MSRKPSEGISPLFNFLHIRITYHDLCVLSELEPELEEVDELPLLDVVVDADCVLQYCSYQVSILCKSAVDVQLAAPQTDETPAVPVRKGFNRESPQKQELETSAMAGGAQAP